MSKHVHVLIYKCRNCGKEFDRSVGSEEELGSVMLSAVLDRPVNISPVYPLGHAIPIRWVHQCNSNLKVFGIGELIRGLESED